VADVRDVPVNRVPAEHRHLGDLAVAQPVRDKRQYWRQGANSSTTVNQPETMF
jgi:hypothetical protein